MGCSLNTCLFIAFVCKWDKKWRESEAWLASKFTRSYIVVVFNSGVAPKNTQMCQMKLAKVMCCLLTRIKVHKLLKVNKHLLEFCIESSRTIIPQQHCGYIYNKKINSYWQSFWITLLECSEPHRTVQLHSCFYCHFAPKLKMFQ